MNKNKYTVGSYDDNTWAVYNENGKVIVYGFFSSQEAYDWIETNEY